VQLKRFDDAYPQLKRSLELSDRFDFVHIAMARVYYHRREYAQAVEAYRKGTAMSPPSAALHQESALALMKIGDDEGAITELLRALKLNPESEELHNNLGTVYGRLGRYEEAKQEFETALKINPGYANAAKNLERLFEIMKKE
jgi:tetratricopeptide (TPR) repeat protein